MASADRTLLRMVFDRIDTSGDGLLQKGELLAAVQNSDIVRAMLGASKGLSGLLKPSTYASTFEALDTDNDGGISFDELCEFAGDLPAIVAKISEESDDVDGEELDDAMFGGGGDGMDDEQDVDEDEESFDDDAGGRQSDGEGEVFYDSPSPNSTPRSDRSDIEGGGGPRSRGQSFGASSSRRSGSKPATPAAAAAQQQAKAADDPMDAPLADEVRRRLRELFDLIDENGDGRLTEVEFIHALKYNKDVIELTRHLHPYKFKTASTTRLPEPLLKPKTLRSAWRAMHEQSMKAGGKATNDLAFDEFCGVAKRALCFGAEVAGVTKAHLQNYDGRAGGDSGDGGRRVHVVRDVSEILEGGVDVAGAIARTPLPSAVVVIIGGDIEGRKKKKTKKNKNKKKKKMMKAAAADGEGEGDGDDERAISDMTLAPYMRNVFAGGIARAAAQSDAVVITNAARGDMAARGFPPALGRRSRACAVVAVAAGRGKKRAAAGSDDDESYASSDADSDMTAESTDSVSVGAYDAVFMLQEADAVNTRAFVKGKMDLAQFVAGDGEARVVCVVANDSFSAAAEVMEATRRGWPVIALGGTHGLADLIADDVDAFIEEYGTHRPPIFDADGVQIGGTALDACAWDLTLALEAGITAANRAAARRCLRVVNVEKEQGMTGIGRRGGFTADVSQVSNLIHVHLTLSPALLGC